VLSKYPLSESELLKLAKQTNVKSLKAAIINHVSNDPDPISNLYFWNLEKLQKRIDELIAKQTMYSNKQFACAISVPNQTWKITENELPTDRIIPDTLQGFIRKNKASIPRMPWFLAIIEKDSTANVTLAVDYQPTASLETYFQKGEQLIGKYSSDYKLLSKISCTQQNTPGIKKIYSGTSDGVLVKGMQVIFKKSDFIYFITCTARPESFAMCNDDFNKIISDFKFTQ
jgi:hypothetical protein